MKSSKINFIYNSLYHVTAIITPLITLPYLTRTLGAEGLGTYSYYQSIAYYFVIFISMGLENYGNRTIATVRDSKEILSKTFLEIFIMQVSFGIFAGLVFCFVLFISSSLNKTMLLIMIPYILSSVFDISWFFYGVEDFKLISLRMILIKTVTTILIFLLVKRPDDIYKYSLLMTMSLLLSMVFFWIELPKYISLQRVRISGVVKHIKPNLVLFVPVVAVSLYKFMDKIMLGSMTSSVEVGYYDSCEKVIQIPMALISSLGNVMMPRMSNLYSKAQINEEYILSVMEKSIKFAMLITTSMSFGLMGLANLFVPWFYGPGFDKCVLLYYVLMPCCIFLAFSNVIRTQFLIPKNYDTIFIISVFVGAFTNLLANLFFIPQMESIGAGIGTFIAELSVLITQVVFVYKKLPIKKYLFISIKYIMYGFIMVVIVYFIPPFFPREMIISIIIKILIGAVVYLVLFVGISYLSHDFFYKELFSSVIKMVHGAKKNYNNS